MVPFYLNDRSTQTSVHDTYTRVCQCQYTHVCISSTTQRVLYFKKQIFSLNIKENKCLCLHPLDLSIYNYTHHNPQNNPEACTALNHIQNWTLPHIISNPVNYRTWNSLHMCLNLNKTVIFPHWTIRIYRRRRSAKCIDLDPLELLKSCLKRTHTYLFTRYRKNKIKIGNKPLSQRRQHWRSE